MGTIVSDGLDFSPSQIPYVSVAHSRGDEAGLPENFGASVSTFDYAKVVANCAEAFGGVSVDLALFLDEPGGIGVDLTLFLDKGCQQFC
jgi:hypothetical protein